VSLGMPANKLICAFLLATLVASVKALGLLAATITVLAPIPFVRSEMTLAVSPGFSFARSTASAPMDLAAFIRESTLPTTNVLAPNRPKSLKWIRPIGPSPIIQTV
jgi:hypothetical protein